MFYQWAASLLQNKVILTIGPLQDERITVELTVQRGQKSIQRNQKEVNAFTCTPGPARDAAFVG